jgi:hypothetical protein
MASVNEKTNDVLADRSLKGRWRQNEPRVHTTSHEISYT